VIDYRGARACTDPQQFCGHVVGFARARFRYPPGTRFPGMPVRWREHGILFPTSGLTYCTAPEIEAALGAGCQVDIEFGVIFPWKENLTPIFLPFVAAVREQRSMYPKGSPGEQYAKLAGNAVYGKTAEGLKPKRVFDMRGMTSIALTPTAMTNAMIAAHITGSVRGVIAEILAGVPPHREVVSVSTDGFLTNARLDELDLSGPVTRRFQALCDLVAGTPAAMLEVKHRARQVIAMRARGQATAIAEDSQNPILARAGVQIDGSKAEKNAVMVRLFLGRGPGDKVRRRLFTPLRDQFLGDKDVVRRDEKVKLNLEYDMKRRPVSPRMVEVNGQQHVAFGTDPWETVEEADRARSLFDVWRRDHCMKTLEDWADWELFRQTGEARRRRVAAGGRVGIRVTKADYADALRRVFLRAYVRNAWGSVRSKPNAEVARLLTEAGYPTTANDLKNARRTAAVSGAIPRTPEVDTLVATLHTLFPDVAIERALIPALVPGGTP
jgi:hypothetical protein